ncbi:hypothetical protein [Streptomyces sp. NPDC096012]|uniref:hypothetical protein n=1 Tax=Streptomyces sp. NPDC096012 TaxID=3155684 RepID=UPI003369DAA6
MPEPESLQSLPPVQFSARTHVRIASDLHRYVEDMFAMSGIAMIRYADAAAEAAAGAGFLVLHLMRCPDEIRDSAELTPPTVQL